MSCVDKNGKPLTDYTGLDTTKLTLHQKDKTISILVDSTTKRIILSTNEHTSSLDVLKEKVEELYKNKNITIDSEKIVWVGSFPVWAPYSSVGPGYSNKNLFFGYLEKKIGSTYYVKGESPNVGYYPYKIKL